jgi:hypothetical protein
MAHSDLGLCRFKAPSCRPFPGHGCSTVARQHHENERADELACRGAEAVAAQVIDNEWGPGASDVYGSLLSQATDKPAERDPSQERAPGKYLARSNPGAASEDHLSCRRFRRTRARPTCVGVPGTYTLPARTQTPSAMRSRPVHADVCSLFARMSRYGPVADGITRHPLSGSPYNSAGHSISRHYLTRLKWQAADSDRENLPPQAGMV